MGRESKVRRDQRAAVGIGFTRHLHVEACVDEVDPVNSAPVGSHEAFETDLVAKDRQCLLVAACEGAVEVVVGTHDGYATPAFAAASKGATYTS